jgi:hypothetical protein
MLRDYDDMGMGLYDDMGAFMTPAMLQEQVIAAGAGAGAILLAAWAMPKLPTPSTWSEPNQHRLRAGLALVGAGLAARMLWDYNRDAAIAVIGGVGGLALAQLIDSYVDANLLGGGNPLGQMPDSSELSAGDLALLGAYNGGALSALEAVNVQGSPGAFARGQFADPTVTPEALMGFGGVVTQSETLGAYGPWMA